MAGKPARKQTGAVPTLPLAEGAGSCFFGFHDLCPFDETDRCGLLIRTPFLDRPPQAGDSAEIVVADAADGGVQVVGTTTAWNFPQGSRQQWRPGHPGQFAYNRWSGSRLVAVVQDRERNGESEVPGGIYAFSPDGLEIYTLDFARLHRLGGYGYVAPAATAGMDPCPDDDGIWAGPVGPSPRRLLLSIRAVAGALGLEAGAGAPPQYLTHVVPSPSGRQLCFLHRYLLPDGGINTTVGVCARDGTGLRLLGSGFYSHFDWADEQRLLIWGRGVNRLQPLRNTRSRGMGRLLRWLRPGYRVAKRIFGARWVVQEHYYLVEVATGEKKPFLPDQLREDGHPSFWPGDRRWLVTDCYPDPAGFRNLFLVDVSSGRVIDLGRLGTPVLAPADGVDDYLRRSGVSHAVVAQSGGWSYFRSRSGYSCDFHPRFNRRGTQVCIDSMHSGRRQVYLVDVSTLVR